MICSRCKKRQAVVFVTGTDGTNTENAGLCLTCARELGIPHIDELIHRMGIDEDNLEELEEHLSEVFKDGRPPMEMFSMIKDMSESEMLDLMNRGDDDDPEEEDDEDEDDSGALVIHAEEVEEDEEDDEDDSVPERRPSPLERLFGGSFQPGGATYSDGSGKKKRSKEPKLRYLGEYCVNLTQKARDGKLDRIVGRDREIERMVQILSRRTKNNPCLIGEPGVGKTAVVEGLALRMVEGSVPPRLAAKELYLVDLTALVAGTQFRGQFESRMKGLIDEVKHQGNVVLFIDEVHTLVGTGDAEGSMNAANIMKPALSRGELQVIGATTFSEYRKHIEKDSALERRFQPIRIDEPSVEDTIAVLTGIKDYYETHHDVLVPQPLLARAVQLSERYITDRFLPDKAIDLLDEACACAALRNKARLELDSIMLKLEPLNAQLNELTENSSENPDYERIAELRSEIMRLEAPTAALRAEAAANRTVTEADLAHVIELWTGIQAQRIEQSEFEKLATLEQELKKHIIGQDEAVSLVAAAVRRSRVQISPRRRPASFIFVGPTGVGKTELVKVLADELFNSPETLIRLDMSEFMEKHSVSKLIGSPPGYVGYDEAGQLTEKVRRKPYSVLLFDEIEKAHPDVLNILLQILDEGRITDSQGRTVNFENTVIIMTSNAGSNINDSGMGFGRSERELSRDKALKALSEFLRPEFLARVDETVCFNPLTKEDFIAIARLMTDEYKKSLSERGMTLCVTDEALAWLADNAQGGKSAARDLRTLIRRQVEDKITSFMIDHMNALPENITVLPGEDGLTLNFS